MIFNKNLGRPVGSPWSVKVDGKIPRCIASDGFGSVTSDESNFTYRIFLYVVALDGLSIFPLRRCGNALSVARKNSGSAMVGAMIARVIFSDGPCPVREISARRHPM